MKRASDYQSPPQDLDNNSILSIWKSAEKTLKDPADVPEHYEPVFDDDETFHNQHPIPFPDTTLVVEQEQPVVYQDYMLNDPEYVGYPSRQMQEDVYRTIAFNLTSQDAPIKVLDVGCGRGDFGHYLKSVTEKQFNGSSYFEYTGIDLNPLVIKIGQEKYKDLGPELTSSGFAPLRLRNTNFDELYANSSQQPEYNWVVHCLDLSLPYTGQESENKYGYLQSIIIKSLDLATDGCVFLLINEAEGDPTDPYLKYNIGTVYELLQNLKLKFAIDQSDFHGLTKIVILKQYNN